MLKHIAASQPGGPAMMAALALSWDQAAGDQDVVRHFALREIFYALDGGTTPGVEALACVSSKALRVLDFKLPEYQADTPEALRTCGAIARTTCETIAQHPEADFSQRTWARMAAAAIGPDGNGSEAGILSDWLEQRSPADKEFILKGVEWVGQRLQPLQRAQLAAAALGAVKELGEDQSPEARALWREASSVLGGGPAETPGGVLLGQGHMIVGGTCLRTRQ
jgi:hypothetical protein